MVIGVITGEYWNTLDEKGRISIPSRIRNEIDGIDMILTRGIDKCVWLVPLEEWKKISENLMTKVSVFNSKTRAMRRRMIAPTVECEIDKAGRINIPQSLRDYADLKKEVVILGIETYIEIWDAEEYNRYLENSEGEFLEAAEELGELLLR